MDFDQVTLLFALLGVAAQATVVGLALLWLVRGHDGDRWTAVRDAVAPLALPAAFVVAATAMAGSLYLSEVAHLEPCRLCIYQRIAVYPLVPILAVALVLPSGRRRWLPYVVWPLTAVGTAVSLYHVLVERFPNLETNACDPFNPCSIVWFRHFGYLTIPALAATAQVTVATFVALVPKPPPDQASSTSPIGATDDQQPEAAGQSSAVARPPAAAR